MSNTQAKILINIGKFLIFATAFLVGGSLLSQHVSEKAAAMQYFGFLMYLVGKSGV